MLAFCSYSSYSCLFVFMPGPGYSVLKPNDSFDILIYLLSTKDASWFCTMMIFGNSFLRVFIIKNFCLSHIFNTMSFSYPLYYYLKMFLGSVATTIFANSFTVFTTAKLPSKAYFQYDIMFIPFSTTI